MTNSRSPFLSILVPLDGSDLAAQALPLAARIARHSGARLRLALVHEHPAVPADAVAAGTLTAVELSTQKAERLYLRGVQARLREDGIPTGSAVTLTGTVGPALVTYAHDLGIDLVVMATHGRGGISRMWLGSTTDYLVRHLDVPVLVVHPAAARRTEAPPGAGQILVPLDGSALAEEALAPAVELARVWDAEVRLLRVVGPIVTADTGYPVSAIYDEDLTAKARASAQAYLDRVILCLHGQGVRATGAAVIGGGAAETILELAHGGPVRMLAIATHGRGGLGRLMLGSVADKLVRGAEVPVLVRPAVKHAPEARRAAPVSMSGRKVRQRA
ncbi:MAG TPA: universal stress protein [Gemmatimonadales bacterium]|nr:universal stress protein [Gemmatimonadales bacterium]